MHLTHDTNVQDFKFIYFYCVKQPFGPSKRLQCMPKCFSHQETIYIAYHTHTPYLQENWALVSNDALCWLLVGVLIKLVSHLVQCHLSSHLTATF